MNREKIIKKIMNYVMGRLEKELPRNLYYHVPAHTMDVYANVQKIGKQEDVSPEDIDLLRVAALFHDLGFIEQYDKNEPIGARMAEEKLPEFGFSADEIQKIKQIIMATQMPHNPQSLLDEIIADADMDNLGRDDFYIQTELLRLELKENGIVISLRQWYGENLPKLFSMHSYFTRTAKTLRDPVKAKHLSEMKDLTGMK